MSKRNKFLNEAKLNEVWQDADGTCYTKCVHDGTAGWHAFGLDAHITDEDADNLLKLPMRRLLDANADIAPERQQSSNPQRAAVLAGTISAYEIMERLLRAAGDTRTAGVYALVIKDVQALG